MNKSLSIILTASLAIFAMFFGAGNLIYPLQAGLESGTNFWAGVAGLILTSVILPLIGLTTIILFNGDYNAFFERIGKRAGFLLIAFSLIVIGPLIAMPRIITISHGMLLPFYPTLSLPLVSALLCILSFVVLYQESKVMDFLGYIVSPILLASLGIVIFKGLFTPGTLTTTDLSPLQTFWQEAVLGYGTLDLLGAIFFGSIALTLLKKSLDNDTNYDLKTLAFYTMQAGFLACSMMGIIYVGIAFLGAYHGQGFEGLNEAAFFMAICMKFMGSYWAIVLATAALLACYSTLIALAAVLAEFVQVRIFEHRISYTYALILVLLLASIISCYGLTTILTLSKPVINVLYPVIITLTFCNLAYKLSGFSYVKTPVLLTLLISLYLNIF